MKKSKYIGIMLVLFSIVAICIYNATASQNVSTQWGAILSAQYEKDKLAEAKPDEKDKSSISVINEMENEFTDTSSDFSDGTSVSDVSTESSVFSDATEDINKAKTDNDLFVISDTDINNTIEFYKLKGESDAEAEASAKEYLEKRQGLYLAAINNGYAVSDEEVWDYLEHLREQLENADNSEEYYEIKSEFPSDEDYWNYEFTVYQKNLPIQKYLSDYAERYSEEIGKDMHSQDFNELWNKKLEELKTEMRDKYVTEFGSGVSD